MNSARLLASLAFAGTLVAGPAFAQGEVNLYTYRETKLIQIGRAHV